MSDPGANQSKTQVDPAAELAKTQSSPAETKSPMLRLVLDGVLKALPTICVLAFAIWLVFKYGDVIGTKLAPNLRGIKAFGVELTFAEDNLKKLGGEIPKLREGNQPPVRPPLSGTARDQIIRRASLLNPLLRNSRVLWVDDHPSNNVLQRNFLQSIGIIVDCAQDNKTAYQLLEFQKLNLTPYDLVISDYDRDREPGETGFTLLKGMRERGYKQEVIYFTSSGEKKPDDAFALTTYSNEFFNFVFDALERTNTAKEDSVLMVDENSYPHSTNDNESGADREPPRTRQ